MALYISCDADNCDSLVPANSAFAAEWLTVVDGEGAELAHCCMWWCLAKVAASLGEPAETIENPLL